MKILVLADESRYRKFLPDTDFARSSELVFLGRECSVSEAAKLASDASVIFADAITPVSAELIAALPELKLIHSEGVGFDKIDLKAASERGIYVCNNKGVNAGAVAEQAVYLMLGVLRSALISDAAVRAGRQINLKEELMFKGIDELGDCKVGLVGLGDIGRETAKRLRPFGCELYYYNRTRRPEAEEELGLTYLPLQELASVCDIISLHMAVTPETTEIINADFFAAMKNTAYLINTARGDLVDNMALREALISGSIAGAGLDTLAPEPVQADNPVVDLPEETKYKVLFSAHLGGVTTGNFRRAHVHMWENAEKVSLGQKPDNIVN